MFDRMQFSGVWRDYQERVLGEMENHLDDDRLHVVAAPGAGKTILGWEIVRRLGRPALIFAPSLAIRDQWRERLLPLFLTEPPSADEVSSDLSNPSKLTLSTYQSLDVFRRSDDLTGLISALNENGPYTLVFDEAHHLRKAWWDCLNRLANELTDVKIVALTATPPYDASLSEWNRYETLCGPIDLEIGIPELVRNGDLCPHQDHVILSEPTEDALSLLHRRRIAISELQHDLRNDDALLDWFSEHPWLRDPDENIEDILAAPEMLSAVLVLLGSAGRSLPRIALDLLGVTTRNLPEPSLFWLERLLDGLLFSQRAKFPVSKERRKALEKRLHRNGLIEGGKVRLRHTRAVFRLLASSIGKMASINSIVKAEQAVLGEGLRLVVLSDHIRAGELPEDPDDEFAPSKLGVIPIFESLRRAAVAPDRLAVLTGSLVMLPKGAAGAIDDVLHQLNIDPSAVRKKDMAPCPNYIELEANIGSNSDLIRIVTALFMKGDVRVIVGTQSLLGQGWDAPALNSLILASNTASFMLSNQMRGRAIRTNPAEPEKVSNIWHLATVEPELSSMIEAISTSLDWGVLNDNSNLNATDIGTVARRFRAFECISNGLSNRIESGLGRLGLVPSQALEMQNAETFLLAADREATADKWRTSLGDGDRRSQVRETTSPEYAPRSLSWSDTIQSAVWTAIATAGVAAADHLRSATSFEGLGLLLTGAAGVATFVGLLRLFKAVVLFWRNGSLESSLMEVTRVVLSSLATTGQLGQWELQSATIEIRESIDGRKDILVANVSRAAERQIMQAIAELLGPVQNPRYLLVRKSWFGLIGRTDYHAVPASLGARKEYAENFADLWNKRVGSSQLLFTRTKVGRRMLLKARMRSLAVGFQRSVDRRSAWL